MKEEKIKNKKKNKDNEEKKSKIINRERIRD